MRPGATFGDLIDRVEGLGRGDLQARVLIHGRGLGDDGPLISPRAKGAAVRALRMEAGNAWVWKPTVSSADGRIAFTWGGDVIVGGGGGEKLFARPHGLVAIT
jgi:hypothetical protein